MRATFRLAKREGDGKLQFDVKGNKFAVVSIVIALVLSAVATFSFVRREVSAYGPYEGTVVSMDRDWLYRWFSRDRRPKVRVRIRAEDGREIVRYMSEFIVMQQRIEPGDFVTKGDGLFAIPQARGKESTPEMLRRLEEELQNAR